MVSQRGERETRVTGAIFIEIPSGSLCGGERAGGRLDHLRGHPDHVLIFSVIFHSWRNSLYHAMPFANSHNGIMALGLTYFGFSVPSIFLADLLGNTCVLARVQKVMVCDS